MLANLIALSRQLELLVLKVLCIRDDDKAARGCECQASAEVAKSLWRAPSQLRTQITCACAICLRMFQTTCRLQWMAQFYKLLVEIRALTLMCLLLLSIRIVYLFQRFIADLNTVCDCLVSRAMSVAVGAHPCRHDRLTAQEMIQPPEVGGNGLFSHYRGIPNVGDWGSSAPHTVKQGPGCR